MHQVVFLIILGVPLATLAAFNPPKGLYFIGVGYNLLKGNPQGGDLSTGGVDPGLLLTRKIFNLTWEKNKLSADKMYNVPDQVVFAPRKSCKEDNSSRVVFGTKDYQKELKVEVGAEAEYDSGLWSFSFSLSARYNEMERETSKEHKVFYDEKCVCNKGQVRLQWDLALQKKYSVSPEFAASVCRLPASYKRKKYLNFIERWGTHVVVEVELGEKSTITYESTLTDVMSYAMNNVGTSVTAGGGYGGFSGSVSLDVETFQSEAKQESKFGSNKKVFRSGGPDLPEPIKVKLRPIYDALKVGFFRKLRKEMLKCNFTKSRLQQLKRNVKKILKKYPKLKGASNGTDPSELSIPLLWPKGTYGLPMPKSGCPRPVNEKTPDFVWHEGRRYHDTEDVSPSNSWSDLYDLAGRIGVRDMAQIFCMKTQEGLSTFGAFLLPWPRGRYCVFKKGECPSGLDEGWILWDDEDSNNKNVKSGSLPDGIYDHDTKMFFCCRSDGFAENAIYLPTNSNFVLFQYGDQCQNVKGMNVTPEFFSWDTEDFSNKNSWSEGNTPVDKQHSGGNHIKLRYCYYHT